MAALAEWPDRINQVFGDTTYPKDGLFTFHFHEGGRLRNVAIDDRLPVMEWGDSYLPMNLRKSPNGAWWGPILEKGAAKFYGRYENMDGGQQAESLYALTGMPTHSVVNNKLEEDELWNLLSDYDQK